MIKVAVRSHPKTRQPTDITIIQLGVLIVVVSPTNTTMKDKPNANALPRAIVVVVRVGERSSIGALRKGRLSCWRTSLFDDPSHDLLLPFGGVHGFTRRCVWQNPVGKDVCGKCLHIIRNDEAPVFNQSKGAAELHELECATWTRANVEERGLTGAAN